jgi:two-component system chemotaxis response regulator CheB
VLVVDDAVVVRRLVARIIEEHPAFAPPITAANGRLALAKLAVEIPDIVVLDIEMPELDGLATLREIRALHPRLPVVMFSTLTESGATATLQALALGATDYVTKPSNTGSFDTAMARVRDELLPKLLALTGRDEIAVPGGLLAARPSRAAGRPLARAARPEIAGPRADRPPATPVEVVAIGSSTGGPNALATLLEGLAPLPVPVVVTQHIPPVFSRMLAQRLDKLSPMTVREAVAGDRLAPGTVHIAPGDQHLLVRRAADGVEIVLGDGPPENSCRPSVDVMLRSVADVFGSATLVVVLTGMGVDGLRGSDTLHGLGARVVVQDQATSVVWGMPGAIAGASLADAVVPLDRLAGEITRRLPSGALSCR